MANWIVCLSHAHTLLSLPCIRPMDSNRTLSFTHNCMHITFEFMVYAPGERNVRDKKVAEHTMSQWRLQMHIMVAWMRLNCTPNAEYIYTYLLHAAYVLPNIKCDAWQALINGNGRRGGRMRIRKIKGRSVAPTKPSKQNVGKQPSGIWLAATMHFKWMLCSVKA